MGEKSPFRGPCIVVWKERSQTISNLMDSSFGIVVHRVKPLACADT